MAERVARRMTADAFLAWHGSEEQRYELIDGVPVAMAGARRQHDQVVVNALLALGGQMQSGPYRLFTRDTAVRISDRQVRSPDLGLDCGTFRPDAFEAAIAAPRLSLPLAALYQGLTFRARPRLVVPDDAAAASTAQNATGPNAARSSA